MPGFWQEVWEDVKAEPWLVPARPKSDDFLYFRGSSERPITAYRFVVASYWSVWIAISVLGSVGVHFPPIVFSDLDNDFDIKWLIFLTNWSMILLGSYLWAAFIASTHTEHNPRLLQVVWVLRNCTAVAALTVSLLFWAVLFPALGRTSLVDVHCHAVNSLIVLVDLTLTHVPYYLKHGWMPFTYLLTYLLFSIVYWLSGGTDPEGDHYIYPPLDYDRPSEAATLVLLVVGVVVPAIHLALYLYNRLLFRKQQGFFCGAPSRARSSSSSAAVAAARFGSSDRGDDRMPLLPN